jgi:hypothetical protein
MEDVTVADVSWDDRRFTEAARLIGRMAVRLTRAAVAGGRGRPAGPWVRAATAESE